MQRILSVETSRSDSGTSEFVTKRLCCSIILTVAFFGFVGGFLLGRFAEGRASMPLKTEAYVLRAKVSELNSNLQKTFPQGLKGCDFVKIGFNATGMLLAADFLKSFNNCLSNG